MSKLSISVPDELVDDLRAAAEGNVSAFVAAAIRHEMDRRRLFAFLDELDDELGPVDEEEVAGFVTAFTEVASPGRSTSRRPSGAARSRSAS